MVPFVWPWRSAALEVSSKVQCSRTDESTAIEQHLDVALDEDVRVSLLRRARQQRHADCTCRASELSGAFPSAHLFVLPLAPTIEEGELFSPQVAATRLGRARYCWITGCAASARFVSSVGYCTPSCSRYVAYFEGS